MSLQRPILITTHGDYGDFYFGRGFVVVTGPTRTDVYLQSGRAFARLRGKQYEYFHVILARAEASNAEGNILDAMKRHRRQGQPILLALSPLGDVLGTWKSSASWRRVRVALREESRREARAA